MRQDRRRRLVLALGLAVGCQPGKPGPATDGEATGEASGPTSASDGTTTGDPCAEVIAGDLSIDDATDIDSLACVVAVTGTLEVRDTSHWPDMTPLAALRIVGGELKIFRNKGLVSLDGLQALERVGGIVRVFDNSRLTGLTGLSGVRRLGGLVLARNALTSLAGLQGAVEFLPASGDVGAIHILREQLTNLDELAAAIEVSAPNGLLISVAEMGVLVDVSGLDPFAAAEGPVELELRELPALTSLRWPGALEVLRIRDAPALEELVLPGMTTAREISLDGLPALGSLAGLSALRSVSGWLSLGLCLADGLDGLVDLHGLEALEQAELVQIHSNASLTALTGLSVDLQAEHVFIRANPMLPQAAAEAWLDAAEQVGKEGYSEACENLGGSACVLGCPPLGE